MFKLNIGMISKPNILTDGWMDGWMDEVEYRMAAIEAKFDALALKTNAVPDPEAT